MTTTLHDIARNAMNAGAELRLRSALKPAAPKGHRLTVAQEDLEALLSVLDALRASFTERGEVMHRMSTMAAEAEFSALAGDVRADVITAPSRGAA